MNDEWKYAACILAQDSEGVDSEGVKFGMDWAAELCGEGDHDDGVVEAYILHRLMWPPSIKEAEEFTAKLMFHYDMRNTFDAAFKKAFA